jgi:hypothetical protein
MILLPFLAIIYNRREESSMEITGVSKQYNTSIPSKKETKASEVKSMSEVFEEAMVGWKDQMKEKLEKEQDDDQKRNIQMSDKKWKGLMNKVDNAIDQYKQELKEEKEKIQQKQDKDAANVDNTKKNKEQCG